MQQLLVSHASFFLICPPVLLFIVEEVFPVMKEISRMYFSNGVVFMFPHALVMILARITYFSSIKM